MNSTLKLIKGRRSMRTSFDPNHSVSREDLEQVLEAATWAPTPHNMQNFEVIVVDDRKVIEELGNIESRVTEAFLRENYEQLSFSEEELFQRRAGILGSAFPAAMRDPSKFKKVAAESPPMRLRYAIDGSPLLLILIYDPRKRAPDSEGDVLGLVGLGCVMENMWLMASSLGISVRILSDFGDAGVDVETKRVLGIPQHLSVLLGLRLGYPVEAEGEGIRVRRYLSDFTYHNRYGKKNRMSLGERR
jgi:nitroreductase